MAEQAITASNPSSLRMHMFVPAIILFATGLSITFTQDLHELLSFNAWVIAIFGVVFGASLFAAPLLGGERTLSGTVVATISVLVGVSAPFMPSVAALGLVLIVWASAVTLATIWHWARTREREALTIGIAAAALAAILVFGARELPAVMGFFAGYCFIIGVHLGIAAFDRTQQVSDTEASFA